MESLRKIDASIAVHDAKSLLLSAIFVFVEFPFRNDGQRFESPRETIFRFGWSWNIGFEITIPDVWSKSRWNNRLRRTVSEKSLDLKHDLINGFEHESSDELKCTASLYLCHHEFTNQDIIRNTQGPSSIKNTI